MKCEACQQIMIDVLYGEEVEARSSFAFFRHLEDCEECHLEYFELLKTRQDLSEWSLDEEELNRVEGLPQTAETALFRRIRWWPLLHKTAAAFLIVIGLITILQNVGIWPNQRVMVSAADLQEAVHDVVLARQTEDWKVIGAALLEMKEEMDSRRRLEMKVIYDEMLALEQRYVDALEENNRNLQTLLTR